MMLRKRPTKTNFVGRFDFVGTLLNYLPATLPVTVITIVFCSG